jgi:hypothetical protein
LVHPVLEAGQNCLQIFFGGFRKEILVAVIEADESIDPEVGTIIPPVDITIDVGEFGIDEGFGEGDAFGKTVSVISQVIIIQEALAPSGIVTLGRGRWDRFDSQVDCDLDPDAKEN